PLPGLLCLRELWGGESEESEALRAAVEETRATAQLPDIPVLIIHGRNDGLIPVALSSRPYVQEARGHGARLAYWEVEQVQHFDALLGAPGVTGRYVPLIPYAWAGLDRVREILAGRTGLGKDRRIHPVPAPAGRALEEVDLGL
ncbi:MAG: 3-hydroxybutyrate oligomer hydrolase family protein, partial [Wenzhouxiangella sp.]